MFICNDDNRTTICRSPLRCGEDIQSNPLKTGTRRQRTNSAVEAVVPTSLGTSSVPRAVHDARHGGNGSRLLCWAFAIKFVPKRLQE